MQTQLGLHKNARKGFCKQTDGLMQEIDSSEYIHRMTCLKREK